ncbi:plasmid partitioning protein RepB [Methylocella tundrae]|jgi:ParB family chromosome partitioning protein|uniref:Plasmid Partitioning protein repB n=1 Tax=Methylocella tundrae TaxID=227605 RepID=A0A4U8Z8I3_METTU|nr:plasmid partitioning protein RepB [Methylocella tundrae]WPP02725.1 plasmid partitioning protein RepB [Methylocella tundrae]VFU17446.1 Plasmid Partitioning protein repB [Methylocella tundrae]
MSRRTPSKSIAANFGALSESISLPDALSTGHDAVPSISAQPAARVGAGVIGATQRTLTDLREERDQLLIQLATTGELLLDPSLIDPSPFQDRLPDDGEAEFDSFKNLIDTEGQKVPIHVRKHPNSSGRYEIVYGHRRWRAAKELGKTVKAFVADVTDAEMAIAQGIENAARQNLTWIEKALFAWRMDQANIKSRDIRAALVIDDAELTRFRSVCRAMSPEILHAIGRAPKIGRPRWIDLATAVGKDPDALTKIHQTLSSDKVSSLHSDERFHLVLAAIKATPAEKRQERKLVAPSGKVIGTAAFNQGNVKLTISPAHADAFISFLEAEIPMIMKSYFAQRGEE